MWKRFGVRKRHFDRDTCCYLCDPINTFVIQAACFQRPGLFAGCHVFLTGKFEYPTTSREDLTSLLQLGGATILAREPRTEHLLSEPCTVPFHVRAGSTLEHCSHYVVHGEKTEELVEGEGRLCHVNVSWVLDSIANFKLLDIPTE